MFRRISRQERERRAARAELETTLQALRSNERAFTEAQDPFYIDQLTYQHAALMCRCRALLRTLRAEGGAMTEYWPCLLAAVCAIAVLRCAARQRHGMRSLLAGAVCGLGALALLGLLEPVTGIALPLNRFTAFCAGVLGLPGVTALLILRLLL